MIDCSFLKIRDRGLFGDSGGSALGSASSRRCDKVTAPHDHFVDDPCNAVTFRSELALLNRALNKNVVAFVEGHGDTGKVTVKREVVPVSVLLWFAIWVLISVTLAEAGIRDGCPGRKVPNNGLSRQMTDDFQAISLHDYSRSFSN